jgi:hypothetical protein
VRELAALHVRRSRLWRVLGPRRDGVVPASAPGLERVAVQLAKALWRLGPEGHIGALVLADELVCMRDGGSARAAPAVPSPLVLA